MTSDCDPFVADRTTAALTFGAVPVSFSPRTPSHDLVVVDVAVAMDARLVEAAPISPSFLAETLCVSDRATAALTFGALPILPMTSDGDPFVADRATAALPFGAVPISSGPTPCDGTPSAVAAHDPGVATAEPAPSSGRGRK